MNLNQNPGISTENKRPMQPCSHVVSDCRYIQYIVKTFVDCGLQSRTVSSTASTEVAACQAQIIVEPLSPIFLGATGTQ